MNDVPINVSRWAGTLMVLLAAWACAIDSVARDALQSVPLAPSQVTADSASLPVNSIRLTEVPHPRTALWPFFKPQRRAVYDSASSPVAPHPAVARISVPEEGATAYGSGTLVDARDQYALVVTNWHVVRDSRGVVVVTFPNGFRSHASPLKVDKDWDLAALVIWRPTAIEPVKLAPFAPQPGDLLTIHGYGTGQYRIATGHCTSYYAPHSNFPQEIVELDVEARQGDSGGPIFNQNGELAGVLFGAGQGTTMGSFGPRVGTFLATLAPDIGQANAQAQVAVADRPAPNVQPAAITMNTAVAAMEPTWPSSPWTPPRKGSNTSQPASFPNTLAGGQAADPNAVVPSNGPPSTSTVLSWQDISGHGWYDPAKSILAVVGLAAVALRLVKFVR